VGTGQEHGLTGRSRLHVMSTLPVECPQMSPELDTAASASLPAIWVSSAVVVFGGSHRCTTWTSAVYLQVEHRHPPAQATRATRDWYPW